MIKVFSHHGVFNFMLSIYDGGHVIYMDDIDLDFISVMHKIKMTKRESMYEDVK